MTSANFKKIFMGRNKFLKDMGGIRKRYKRSDISKKSNDCLTNDGDNHRMSMCDFRL